MSSIECTIVLKYFLEYDHAMRNNVSAAFENLFNVRINKGDTLRVRSNFIIHLVIPMARWLV